jgi:hypothetical protein
MESVVTGATDELKKLPSAATSMIYFLCITIIYGFMMIYNTIASTTLTQVVSNANNPIYTLIYIIFLISGTYFINVNISKSICIENTIRWGSVFSITILPWLIIFGVLYLMLELYPGWINPFSNTIGFLIVNSLGATQAVKDMLKESTTDRDTTLKKALENIEKNYSRFINEIDSDKDNYSKFIKQLYNENFIAGNNSDGGKSDVFLNSAKSVNLFALINVKKIVGKLFWYVLAGTLIASISYNFIINMTCEKTLDQSKKEYDKLYENTNLPIIGKKWQKIREEPSESDNQDYTTQLSSLISKYGDDFVKDDKNEIELTKHQLREIGMSYEELPNNSYIQIDDSYFRPVA